MADSDLIAPFPWPKKNDRLSYMRIGTWLLLTGMHDEADNLLKSFELSFEEVENIDKSISEAIDPFILAAAIWALSKNTGHEVPEILQRVSLHSPKVKYLYDYATSWREYVGWDVSLSPVAYVSDIHLNIIHNAQSPKFPDDSLACHIFYISLVMKKVDNKLLPKVSFAVVWKYRYCSSVISFLNNDGQIDLWHRMLLLGPLIRIQWRIIIIQFRLMRNTKKN